LSSVNIKSIEIFKDENIEKREIIEKTIERTLETFEYGHRKCYNYYFKNVINRSTKIIGTNVKSREELLNFHKEFTKRSQYHKIK